MTPLERAVGDALGEDVTLDAPIGGGSISAVATATTRSGLRIVVKSHTGAPADMFGCEARGLDWLRVPGGPRIPRVLAFGDGAQGFIALEYVERGPGHRDDAEVGRRIAVLHRAAPESFGLDHDNYLATIPQHNGITRTWPEFLAERRLRPFARIAQERGRLPGHLGRAIDRLADRCDRLVGPPEPPARLHGDLWSGNLMIDRGGVPTLIDPAVYGGHREIDLAMMRLFGGFGERVFAAYDEVHPPAEGRADRVALNQVLPLLVHVILFSGGYVGQLEAAVGRYVPLR